VYRNYVVLRSGWEWELSVHETEFRCKSIFGNLDAARRWLSEGHVQVDELYTRMSPRECQRAYRNLLQQRTEQLAVVFDWTERHITDSV
jgi:hypothetical protein